jgi:hypothetical protein
VCRVKAGVFAGVIAKLSLMRQQALDSGGIP